jgi:4-hydroxythreonine-4-phosphate dehydrogenase
MGEPAGIGGEIALAAWERLRRHGPPFALLDDPARIARLAAALGREVPVRTVASPAEAVGVFADALPVLDIGERIVTTPGRPSPATAGAVIGSIRRAVELVRAGAAPALVTNPIQKSALTAAGFGFPGHTEFLAHLAGVERPVMMLAGPDLRVVPITVHVPVSAVPGLLTHDLVVETARITHAALRDSFGIARPRLALAGLNPHAGEDGTIGTEDRDVLRPAASLLRAEGIDITDPLPADTMFHTEARRRYDVALCPTHDQALIPLKTLAFDDGVNLTLGLPFVRTSPDHGTALDIAGKGVARPDSLIAAIRLAAELGHRHNRKSAA